MRILAITDYLPYPLVSGDRIRVYNLLRRIAWRHEVVLVSFLEKPEDVGGMHHLQQFCACVETVGFQPCSRPARIRGMLGYALAGRPPELSRLYSQELEQTIARHVREQSYDIVQLENAHMSLYWEVLPQSLQRRSILMLQNVTSQQHGRIARIEKRWDRKLRMFVNSAATRHWEPHYAANFARCTTVSEMDRRLLLQANPRLRISVIPNGVDIEQFQLLSPQVASANLLFVGNMGYPPCADAAVYFCSEVLPHLRRVVPGVELWLVGRDPTPEVLQLANEYVHVTGRVESVIPYYQRCSVCVVPLRAGGGTRLKILEAMALGRPVVSTTIGCEGLDVADGQHLLLADSPEHFAQQTARLLSDPELYCHLAANGRRLVEERYDWNQIAARLMDVYAEILQEAPGDDGRLQ